jgi:hypothetical protein
MLFYLQSPLHAEFICSPKEFILYDGITALLLIPGLTPGISEAHLCTPSPPTLAAGSFPLFTCGFHRIMYSERVQIEKGVRAQH